MRLCCSEFDILLCSGVEYRNVAIFFCSDRQLLYSFYCKVPMTPEGSVLLGLLTEQKHIYLNNQPRAESLLNKKNKSKLFKQ